MEALSTWGRVLALSTPNEDMIMTKGGRAPGSQGHPGVRVSQSPDLRAGDAAYPIHHAPEDNPDVCSWKPLFK